MAKRAKRAKAERKPASGSESGSVSASNLERLRGTAREMAGERSFRRVTLESDGKRVASIDEGEIDFDLEGGGVVTVELPADGLALVRDPDPEVRRGAWSEIRELPEAKGIKKNLVAPFAEVRLSVLRVAPGDAVELRGVVVEHAFAEPGAPFREGAKRRPSRVFAEMLAFGAPPDELMRAMTMAIAERARAASASADQGDTPPAPPAAEPLDPWSARRPAAWVPLGAALAGALGWGVAAATAATAAARWSAELMAIPWLAVAVSFRPFPAVPRWRSRGTLLHERSPWGFGARLVLGAVPVCAVAWGWGDDGRSGDAWLVVAGGFMVSWFLTELLWNGRSHGLLATLFGAKRLNPVAEASSEGTCTGIARAARPVTVGGERAAMGVVTRFSRGFGDEPDTEEGQRFSAPRKFVVETPEGEVEVDPDACVWATTMTREPGDRGFGYSVPEWIPVGGRVALFGRYVRLKETDGTAARLLSIGNRPAIVYATSAAGDPLRRAAEIVRHRRITLGGLAALAGAVAALALLRPG